MRTSAVSYANSKLGCTTSRYLFICEYFWAHKLFPYLKSPRQMSTIPSRISAMSGEWYIFEFQMTGVFTKISLIIFRTVCACGVGVTKFTFLAPCILLRSISLASFLGSIRVPASGQVEISQFWQQTQAKVQPVKKIV